MPASGLDPQRLVQELGIAGERRRVAVAGNDKVHGQLAHGHGAVHEARRRGAIGAILTGVFATKALTPDNAGGLLSGNVDALVTQLIGVGAAAGYSALVTFIILKVLKATMGLRVSADEERAGLDVALHGESGYSLGSGAASVAMDPEPEPTPKAVIAREELA